MKEEAKRTDYDLSVLNLDELITLYENILDFLNFLDDKKVEEDEKGELANE